MSRSSYPKNAKTLDFGGLRQPVISAYEVPPAWLI